jgi:hypothetical protein
LRVAARGGYCRAVREREPEPAPAQEASAAKGPAPRGILELRSQIGNRAMRRLLAREEWDTPVDAPKGAVLISFDKIEAVYVSYHKQMASSRGLKVNDPSVRKAAGAATRTQVGSLNYDRWLAQRGGLFLTDVIIGPIEYKSQKQEDQENQDYEETYGATGRANQYKSLKARAQKINQDVVAAEYHAHKLKTPEGIKGFLYEKGGAAFGVMYGIGARSASFARDKMNPVQQASETAFGYDTKKGVYDNTVGKQVDDVKKMASELSDTASTSYDLAAGKLHELYLKTRPPYDEFQKALSEFYGDTGTSAFNRAQGMMDEMAALGVMNGAVSRMETSGLQYLVLCAALNIKGQSAALNKLSQAIEAGMVNSVEMAVDILAGEVIGGGTSKPGKLKGIPLKPNQLTDPIPGHKVLEPALEVGKAGVKEAAKPEAPATP